MKLTFEIVQGSVVDVALACLLYRGRFQPLESGHWNYADVEPWQVPEKSGFGMPLVDAGTGYVATVSGYKYSEGNPQLEIIARHEQAPFLAQLVSGLLAELAEKGFIDPTALVKAREQQPTLLLDKSVSAPPESPLGARQRKRQEDVKHLHNVELLTQPEIAERLGFSLATVQRDLREMGLTTRKKGPRGRTPK